MRKRTVALARDLARVVVPVACPGCGALDVRWCEECEAPWWDAPERVESGAGRLQVWERQPLPVWSIATLDGAAHHMIAAWKDHHRRDLDSFFAATMTRAACHIAPSIAQLASPITVVPAPARRHSTRERGVDLPGILAAAAVKGLVESAVSAQMGPRLRVREGKSRGTSARQRWNHARSIAVAGPLGDAQIAVVVDDVVTTGATLAGCVEALERAGVIVIAALTLASTQQHDAPSHVGLR